MINASNGEITFGVLGQKSGFEGASGEGKLATITFIGLAEGNSPVSFVLENHEAMVVYRYSDNEKGFEKTDILTIDGSITVQKEGQR